MWSFVVTCGRGFEKHVIVEVEEKICHVMKVNSPSDGKVFFNIDISNCKYSYECLAKIYHLKMVERVMLLLHYTKLENVSECNGIGVNEAIDLTTNSISWEDVNKKIQILLKARPPSSKRAACSCPGSCDDNSIYSFYQNKKRKFDSIDILDKNINSFNTTLNTKSDNENVAALQNETENLSNSVERQYASSDIISYRVSCRFTGKWRDEIKQINKERLDLKRKANCIKGTDGEQSNSNKQNDNPNNFCSKNDYPSDSVEFLTNLLKCKTEWEVTFDKPHVDVYYNLTDEHTLLGISLTRLPLSLRPYIPHINLRSSVCNLMLREALLGVTASQTLPSTLVRCAQESAPEIVTQPVTLLDPMCGSGTLLCEAVHSFRVEHVVGSDISEDQVAKAVCNLSGVQSAVVSLMHANATALPLPDCSVSAVVCDVPFGQNHQTVTHREDESFWSLCLGEMSRVTVNDGKICLLLAEHMETLMYSVYKEISLEPLGRRSLSLGRTKAVIHILKVKK